MEDNDDDDSDDDYNDENKQYVPPATSTPEQSVGNQRPPGQLRRSTGFLFDRLENIPQSVLRSFHRKFL